MRGRVLICAGSDSGGGAGIQADIKTVTALGGYAATAITALTAQNTRGVFGVLGVAPDFVRQQMTLVLDDIGADAIKTGMLADSTTIGAVAAVLKRHAGGRPIVVDPVMVAQSGDPLLEDGAMASLRAELLPLASVIAPNLPEAETLLGRAIDGPRSMEAAARDLLATGASAVLLKGGHAAGETVIDVLAWPDGLERFESPRIPSGNNHGTGCTLASAVAAGLAQDLSLRDAVARARAYVQAAIRQAPGYGAGNGPLDHLAGAGLAAGPAGGPGRPGPGAGHPARQRHNRVVKAKGEGRMSERYFDDFQVGETFLSQGVTLSESQILDFALLYDPQPFHIDLEAAAKGPFGGLIASGFQTLALTFRMFYQERVFSACGMGSPGFDELRWLKPVRPGDTIHAEAEVLETRPSSSKPDRGVVRLAYRTVNQHGETVMSFTAIQIMARKG